MIYNVWTAKTNLSKLIEQALSGEEVVIARDNQPAVLLVPVQPKPRGRRKGALAGKFEAPDSAFAPMSEDELALWEGSPDARPSR